MKRFLTIIAALLVCAPVFSVFIASASAGTATYLRGDANGDGVITIDDASLIQRIIARLTYDTDGRIALRGDVNGNGLSITDATYIQNYLANNSNEFNVGDEATQIIEPPTQGITFDPYELPIIPNK